MKKAKIKAAREFQIGKIDRRIFGSFIEHLGRAVYGGIYDPGNPLSNADGFRIDVIDKIKRLGVPLVRYPGGNFVSGYNWEDGIGPKEKRPKRLELAWGTTETNEFGTDEFMKWCRLSEVEPMMAVNLGTRDADAARALVEYCNHEGGTYYSDLRKKYGAGEPYNVKLWCLGNEMDGSWQMGAKSAAEYGHTAAEASKVMKLTDPNIETVLCGSSNCNTKTFMDWELQSLGEAYDFVDYVSLHQYLDNKTDDLESFLAKSTKLDSFIDSVTSACDVIKAKKRSNKTINLSFDEWNVWYHSNGAEFEKWSKAPHILEDIYNFEDALVDACMLMTLLRHCDRVKIACLAQLVNVIAPIMTDKSGSFEQTIYFPFADMAKYAEGAVLSTTAECDRYDCREFTSVPYLESVMTYNESADEAALFAVNRSKSEELETELKLLDFDGYKVTGFKSMDGFAPKDTNTFDNIAVKPHNNPLPEAENGLLKVNLKPLSWNVITLKKRV